MSQSVGVSPEYQPLFKYLDGRFANIVVLRITEIEDILGFTLPELARRKSEWWATEAVAPSAQSCSWIRANRTAEPNLLAGTVLFERAAG